MRNRKGSEAFANPAPTAVWLIQIVSELCLSCACFHGLLSDAECSSEIGYRSVSMRCSPLKVALKRAAQQISNKNTESQLCSLAVFAFNGVQK